MTEWMQTHLKDLILIITSCVTLASLITALTPTPRDDLMVSRAKQILKVVYKLLDVLALNIGKAKDK